MPQPILRLLIACLLTVPWLAGGEAHARTAQARVAKITTAVGVFENVVVRLDWPDRAPQGQLHVQAASVEAPELGYRFRDVTWQCPLRRDGARWRCEGDLRSGRAAPMRLAIDIDEVRTDARLARGGSVLALHRDAAAPDLTRIDLTRVPLLWTQAMLAKAWEQGRFTKGTLDGRLTVAAPANAPMRITGPVRLGGVAFATPDGTIAGENVGAQAQIDARIADTTHVKLDGSLLGGDLLFGNAYLALQQRRVGFSLDAVQRGAGGWEFPRLHWQDGDLLEADGSAALAPDATLRSLDLRARSVDAGGLRDAYLTGFLGLAGLADLQLRGGVDTRTRIEDGELREADFTPHALTIDDPQGRFDFDGLEGDVRFSSVASIDSELRWHGGALHGLSFGAARLPFTSRDGVLSLREAATVPMLGGQVGFDHLQLRPPSGERGLEIRFGMELERLDIAALAKALDWPAFTGELTGHIPEARYAGDRLEFEGGLAMQLFGGSVQVSSLAMERPFGVAPTLSSDIAFDNIDLEALTGVLGFGAVTGKLDGSITHLRLVDWQPVAFDAELHSDRAAARAARVRQRISQRAVQDLSSVSDASFISSLQSQLIGVFDDFGYSRIGIRCRLNDEVCEMEGLGSAGPGFIIVEGSGVPRLSVVGFNRRVDWPILLERLEAASKGDVSPVFE
ncbi:hypothetical protein [Lysobacter niastensis]|uniref:Dicarboxylate transport domain-containing protein n=1 Tax=Lysobacter niastensis TaxID=380629 RepID=A0ABS0B7D6_9GAMM|nr:hypothetical protein [Lysobacter niastensis]MBF6023569.1 hypothetical protein [Lysobacter niastensis]